MFEKAAFSKEELPKYSHDTDSACLTFIARLKSFIETEITG